MKVLLQIPRPFSEMPSVQDPRGQMLLESGLHLGAAYGDFHEASTPLWADGDFVLFKAGRVESAPGWSHMLDAGSTYPVNDLVQTFVDKRQRLYFSHGGDVYCWQEETDKYAIFSGTQTGPWSLLPYGRWLLMTNGQTTGDEKIGLHLWANDFGDIAHGVQSAPFQWAKLLRLFGPHVLAFNTDRNYAEFCWCHEDNPFQWIDSPENSAGSLTIRDLGSEIIAAEMLGDRMAVYAKDSMHIVTYLGSPFYFGTKRLASDIGAVGPRAIAVVGRRHFGLGRGGFWVSDGVNPFYIGEKAIWPLVDDEVDGIDWSFAEYVTAFHDEREHLVVWSYPLASDRATSATGGVNGACVAFNYVTNTWTRFVKGLDSGVPRQVFDFPVITAGGGIYLMGEDNIAGRVEGAANPYVITKPLDLGRPTHYKRIQLVRLGLRGRDPEVTYGDASQDIRLKLYAQDEAIGEPGTAFYDEVAEVVNHIPDYETPYLVIRVEGVHTPWTLDSITVEGQFAGAVA